MRVPSVFFPILFTETSSPPPFMGSRNRRVKSPNHFQQFAADFLIPWTWDLDFKVSPIEESPGPR